MKRILLLTSLLSMYLINDNTYAEQSTDSYTVLEMVAVTIHINNGKPYGELSSCSNCPARLLPFAPGALAYVNGQKNLADSLQDGQALEGTVFIRRKPIDSINELIAK